MHRGDVITAPLLADLGIAEGCRQRSETAQVVGMERRGTGMADGRGRSVMRTAWVAEETAETAPYQDLSLAWDRETGLALDWALALRTGSSGGRLVDTDAFDR